MPLHRGKSEKVVGGNIREMRAAGHPEAQAVAAAERMKDKSMGRTYGDLDVGRDSRAPYTAGMGRTFGDMDMGRDSHAPNTRGGLDLAGGKYGDANLRKKAPKMAVSIGVQPMGHEEPDGDEGAEGEGGDDQEKAMSAAGDAAIAALHAGDGLSFMRALVAGVHATGGEEPEEEPEDTEAADLEFGESRHGHDAGEDDGERHGKDRGDDEEDNPHGAGDG